MEQTTKNTALLVMDMQAAMVSMLPDGSGIVNNVAKAITNARSKDIPIIYVVVGFRPGAPEISANNKSFMASKSRMTSVDTSAFMKIHDDVEPRDGDITVVKRRVSAFTGSDLEVVLRSLGIQNIVLTGIATSGVVLSTTREAADRDYRMTILADCCADTDAEVHQVLTTKIFPRQADVLTVDEWSKR